MVARDGFAQDKLRGHKFCFDGNCGIVLGLQDFYYDCENRLFEVTRGIRNTTEYSYDYAGRRVRKKIARYGTVEIQNYVYDGDQVIAEYDVNDTLLRKFVYGPGIDEPILMIDAVNSKTYYYHFDGLGSVAALSNVNGGIVERYEYKVFGYDTFGEQVIRDANGTIIDESQVGNPYMFTSRRYDDETGLYYYRARYYAPQIGRFMQPDRLSELLKARIGKRLSIKILKTYPPSYYLSYYLKMVQVFRNTNLLSENYFVEFPEVYYYPYPLLGVSFNEYINSYSFVTNNPVNIIDPHGNLGVIGWVGIGLTAWLVIEAIQCFKAIGDCMEVANDLRKQCDDTQDRWNKAMQSPECQEALDQCPDAVVSSYVP